MGKKKVAKPIGMTFWEAVLAARAGKCVQLPGWTDGDYLTSQDGKLVIASGGRKSRLISVALSAIDSTEWREVEIPTEVWEVATHWAVSDAKGKIRKG